MLFDSLGTWDEICFTDIMRQALQLQMKVTFSSSYDFLEVGHRSETCLHAQAFLVTVRR